MRPIRELLEKQGGSVWSLSPNDSVFHALEMLAAILDGHEGARFSKNLVRTQRLAVSAGAGYDATARGPALFYISASPSRGRTVAELEAALRAEISRIAEAGVTALPTLTDPQLFRHRAALYRRCLAVDFNPLSSGLWLKRQVQLPWFAQEGGL